MQNRLQHSVVTVFPVLVYNPQVCTEDSDLTNVQLFTKKWNPLLNNVDHVSGSRKLSNINPSQTKPGQNQGKH